MNLNQDFDVKLILKFNYLNLKCQINLKRRKIKNQLSTLKKFLNISQKYRKLNSKKLSSKRKFRCIQAMKRRLVLV